MFLLGKHVCENYWTSALGRQIHTRSLFALHAWVYTASTLMPGRVVPEGVHSMCENRSHVTLCKLVVEE